MVRATWYNTIEGNLEERISAVVSEKMRIGKEKGQSDRTILRAAINLMRTRLRKQPLEKISTGQFRRIWLKYDRNTNGGKTARKESMIAGVKSGMNKSKASDSQ